MRVRMVRAWQTYRVGDVLNPTGMLRDWLLRSGFAVPVGDLEVIETTAVEPRTDVTAKPPKRKRGRPRKHPLPT